MEIITYVREGAITHQDSLGNKGRTEAGDVQVMSAGSGIRHSEYNLEPTRTKIFQIWIEPTTQGGAPTWGAKPFPKSDRSGSFVTIASGFDRRQGRAADPRRCAGARHHAEGRRERANMRRARPATSIWCRPPARSRSTACASMPATASRSATRPRLKITALEDSELVLVDAA